MNEGLLSKMFRPKIVVLKKSQLIVLWLIVEIRRSNTFSFKLNCSKIYINKCEQKNSEKNIEKFSTTQQKKTLKFVLA